MNRTITIAQMLAVLCFGALTFVAGLSFREFAGIGKHVPQPVAEKMPEAKPGIRQAATDAIEAPDPKPVLPRSASKTFALLPTQAVNLPNRHFRDIEIRSEYPLQILTGPCHEVATVEFFCQSDPSDIFIRDTRNQPIFATPRANNVTITVKEF